MITENIKIVELDSSNWYDCCQLKVSTEQEQFIETNAISIAQSKFEETLKPFAIYCDEVIVGFLMFNSVKEELDAYWIYRIMIDEKYQGRGIAKKATVQMISEMSKLPDAKKLVVGYHPDNKSAHFLYKSLGFIDNGDRFGKEMAVVKEL